MASESDSSGAAHSPAPAIDADQFAGAVVAMEGAAQAAAAEDDPATRPLLARFAIVASFVGRYADAQRVGELLRERARRDGDALHLARAELALGVRALYLGAQAEARVHLDRARSGAPDAPAVAYATAVSAELQFYGGEHAAAEQLALVAAAAAAAAGDPLAGSAALRIAGLAAAHDGRAEDARGRLRAALETAIEARDGHSQLRALEAIGLLESTPPGPARALRLLSAAGRHRRRLGLARPSELARRVALRVGELRYVLGDSPFEEGSHDGATLSIPDAIALALE